MRQGRERPHKIALGAAETRGTHMLKPHPLSEKVYGANASDLEMAQSIRELGVMTPILITEDNQIVSGHRRWHHAKMVGVYEVPVTVGKFRNELEIEQAVIEANRQRIKSEEQKAREVRELKRIARKRAEARRASKLKQNQADAPDTDPENLPERETGDSRDIAAASVGWSGKTGDKAVAVVDAIDEALKTGDVAKAFDLRDTLNGKSVSAAYAKVAPPREPQTEMGAGPYSGLLVDDDQPLPEWLPEVGEMVIGDYTDGVHHGVLVMARHDDPEFVRIYHMQWTDYDTNGGGTLDGLKRGIRIDKAGWVLGAWAIPMHAVTWTRGPAGEGEMLDDFHRLMNPEYYHHKLGMVAKKRKG